MTERRISGLRVRKPRYACIAEDLSIKIQTGAYKIGSLLPSEAELCKQYDVSHHTARSAIAFLKDMRLVVTEQGRGSRVVSRSVRERYVHTLDSIPEFGERAKDTKIHVIQRDLIDAEEADDVVLPLGSRWYRLEALRYINNEEPLVWKRIYVPEAFSKAAKTIGRSNAPIYTLIERFHHEKPLRVHQEISACHITGRIAELLRVDDGAAGLVIARQYFGANGRITEVTRSIYPSNQFRYSSDLQLEV